MRRILIGLAVLLAISLLGTVSALADAGCEQCAAAADGCESGGACGLRPAAWLAEAFKDASNDRCQCGCWTATTDLLFLTRSNPRSAVLVTNSFGTGTTLLDAADYRFDTATGVDFALTRRNILGTCWDLEAIYTVVDAWNASIGTISSPNGSTIRFITPIGNTFFPSNISSTYRSELHSIELNGKRPLGDRLTLIAGFRYLDLSEEGLAILQDIGPGLNLATFSIAANNRLTGGQLGLDANVLRRGRFALDSTIKAGIYNNDAHNRVSVAQNVGPTFASNASANQTAFVGELGVMGVYDVNCRLSLRAGYRLMWIDGVALASNQIAVSDPANARATVHTADTLFMHGATVGAEYRW